MDEIHIYQYASNPVCAPYRFDFPGKLLNQRPGFRVSQFTEFDSKAFAAILNDGDMFFIQRLPMSPTLAKVLSELNRRGIPVIFDIDDNLLQLTPDSRFSQLANANYERRIRQSLEAAQAVQCSTPRLAEALKNIHPEVAVLENQLDAVPSLTKRKIGDPIIIGYAAGEDHYLDWLTIKERYHETVSDLDALGHPVETYIIGDRAIFESLTTPRKKYLPFLPRQAYLEFLQQIDISLIPLADNAFNRCKSDVKFLESAACGAAVVASQVVFQNCVEHAKTGFLFDTLDEFATVLKRLIRNPALIQNLARNAYDFVSQNRLMQHHLAKWETTYRQWYERRGELLVEKLCQG